MRTLASKRSRNYMQVYVRACHCFSFHQVAGQVCSVESMTRYDTGREAPIHVRHGTNTRNMRAAKNGWRFICASCDAGSTGKPLTKRRVGHARSDERRAFNKETLEVGWVAGCSDRDFDLAIAQAKTRDRSSAFKARGRVLVLLDSWPLGWPSTEHHSKEPLVIE